jgi:hypothetical protein
MADEAECLKKQTGEGYTRQARSVRASRTLLLRRVVLGMPLHARRTIFDT